jgi:hypothetical protein
MCRRTACIPTLIAAALLACTAQAAEVTVGADLASARVWRGITFNSTPVLEPFLRAGGFGRLPLLVSVHGTIDIGDEGGTFDAEGFSELELEAALDLPHGIRASYVEFLYPGPRKPRGIPVTREVSLGWLWIGPIEPGVMVHYDVDNIDDVFVEAYLGRTFRLAERTHLTLEAEAGHAGKRFGAAEGSGRGGFHDYSLGALVAYRPTESLGLTVRAGYAGTFHEALPRQAVGFYAAVGVSLAP